MSTYDTRLVRLEEQTETLSNAVQTLIRDEMDYIDRFGGELLAKAYGGTTPPNERRLNQFENRLNKLEARLEAMADELGDVALRVSQNGVIRPTAAEDEALNTLAEAVSAGRHRQTPEGLLERAERVVSDPTTMGEISTYVSAGQLKEAAAILAKAEDYATKTENDQALDQMGEHTDKRELEATVAQLTETVANLQHTFNSVLSRLSALETRRQVNPLASQTVAKAQGQRRRLATSTDPRETAEGLMTRAEGVIDSPAVIGQLSSMAQGGELDRLREIVEAAELRHETAIKKRDRRTL